MGYKENRIKGVKNQIQAIGVPRDHSEAGLLQSHLALLGALLKYSPYEGAANDETYKQGVNALEKYRNEQYEKQRPAREQQEKEDEMVSRYTSDPKLLNDLTLDELIDLKFMIKSRVEDVEDEKRALSSMTQKTKEFLSPQHPKSAGLIDFIGQILSDAPNLNSHAPNLNKRKRFLELIEDKIKQRANPPIPEDKRTKSQNRIRNLKLDKAKDIEGMREEGEDEESIKRRENMWDDAISREEEELRKVL
jgi:hypothetical protein